MSEARKKKAAEIATGFLRRTGGAIMSNDFETFSDCFALPHMAETFDGSNLIETEDDLRVVFDNIFGRLMEMGVTDLVRHVVAADFLTNTKIQAAYETRLMHNKHLLQDPYPNHSTLALIDGVWKIADSKYATNVPALIAAINARSTA